jgi:hypothetical protein
MGVRYIKIDISVNGCSNAHPEQLPLKKQLPLPYGRGSVLSKVKQYKKQRWLFCLSRKSLPRPPAFLRKQDGGLAMTFCKGFQKSNVMYQG